MYVLAFPPIEFFNNPVSIDCLYDILVIFSPLDKFLIKLFRIKRDWFIFLFSSM